MENKPNLKERRRLNKIVDKYLIDEGFGNSVAKIQSYINSNMYKISKAQSKPERRELAREFILDIKDMITKGTNMERMYLTQTLRDIENEYYDLLRK